MTEQHGGEKGRRAADELRRRADHAEQVLEQVEQARREAEEQERAFTTPSERQLVRKLTSSESPMIVYQSWNGGAPTGGTVDYTVGISNPDPTQWIWLFVHLFVGPGTIASDPGTGALAVDPRFPRLTAPSFAGLTLDPGATEPLKFAIPIPSVETSSYLGNSFLFQSTWHDEAKYLDRGLFVFDVT